MTLWNKLGRAIGNASHHLRNTVGRAAHTAHGFLDSLGRKATALSNVPGFEGLKELADTNIPIIGSSPKQLYHLAHGGASSIDRALNSKDGLLEQTGTALQRALATQ